MKNDSNANIRGMSFLLALQILFIIFKVCNVISWSWWLVLIPLWIDLIEIITIIIVILVMIFSPSKSLRKKKRSARLKW